MARKAQDKTVLEEGAPEQNTESINDSTSSEEVAKPVDKLEDSANSSAATVSDIVDNTKEESAGVYVLGDPETRKIILSVCDTRGYIYAIDAFEMPNGCIVNTVLREKHGSPLTLSSVFVPGVRAVKDKEGNFYRLDHIVAP